MKVFGLEPWGPALDDPSLFVGKLTRKGEKCTHCDEEVTSEDSGVVMPYLSEAGPEMRVEHRECFLRGVLGSVGHQRGLCSCHGGPGTMDDPPGMTKREAAFAAVDWWETHRP